MGWEARAGRGGTVTLELEFLVKAALIAVCIAAFWFWRWKPMLEFWGRRK